MIWRLRTFRLWQLTATLFYKNINILEGCRPNDHLNGVFQRLGGALRRFMDMTKFWHAWTTGTADLPCAGIGCKQLVSVSQRESWGKGKLGARLLGQVHQSSRFIKVTQIIPSQRAAAIILYTGRADIGRTVGECRFTLMQSPQQLSLASLL